MLRRHMRIIGPALTVIILGSMLGRVLGVRPDITMKLSLTVIAFLLALFHYFSSLRHRWVSKDGSLQLLTTAHFDISYLKADSRAARDVAKVLEDNFDKLMNLFRPSEYSRITVTLYPDQHSYHKAQANPHTPDWLLGNATRTTIRMVSPISYLGVGNTYSGLLSIAVHEFVHCITAQLNPEMDFRSNQWLTEGVAVYYAGQEIPSPRRSHPTLADMNTTIDLAYTLGSSAVRYILEAYGTDKLRRLIVNNGDIPGTLGVTVEQFEANWHQWLVAK